MDEEIRLAAFQWLEQQALSHKDFFPRSILERGFTFKNERITLVGPRGIWKPKNLSLPLSITTIANGPYEDSAEGNFLTYQYRGTDPYHSDNVGLRELMERKIPLIYFFGFAKGKYAPAWPVFIQSDNMLELNFRVLLDEHEYALEGSVQENSMEGAKVYGRRSYVTSTFKRRLHQKSFRERVMRAYKNQCSLCRLKHTELLDAAHIIPDGEDGGEPVVVNGLSLCKIHHAAFDNNILGITPDYLVQVRTDVLHEIDGPMLKYGIQSLNNSKVILPNQKHDWPAQERLDVRYNRFLNAM